MKSRHLLALLVLVMVGLMYVAGNSISRAETGPARLSNASLLYAEMRTQVPLMLPVEIPGTNPNIEAAVVGSLRDDSMNLYTVSLDYGQNCSGSSYCNFGSVSGELITERTLNPAEEANILFSQPSPRNMPQSPDEYGSVLLSNNIEGYFIPWKTMASCTEAQMYWKEDEYQYRVGLECGSVEDVTALANSAIESHSQYDQ